MAWIDAPGRPTTFSRPLAAACLLLLLLTPFLRVKGGDVVVRAGPLRAAVPGACLFKSLTGVDCPFCGLSRGYVCAARLEFGRAVSHNWASLPAFVLVLGYALGGMLEFLRRRPLFEAWGRAVLSASRAALGAVLAMGWLVRILAGAA
jgi:hypothetical protein